MEKTNDSHHLGGMNHDDQGLSDELESLYHRVARFDESAVSGEQISGTHQRNHYTHDAKELDRNSEGCRSLQNQEELMEKLMTIKEAYEKILTYWPYSSSVL